VHPAPKPSRFPLFFISGVFVAVAGAVPTSWVVKHPADALLVA
jgi:hypothetical protein